MNEEPVWRAWVIAHHANGCAERFSQPDAERCRYRAAHVKTAQQIADILYAQGYRLTRSAPAEAESLPLFGEISGR